MADTRLFLDEELRSLIESTNVYFQPPASICLKYPCIVYQLSDILTTFANNKLYKSHRRWQITYITPDPDDSMVEKMLRHFPMCTFSRHFTSDRLNHYIFDLYY